MYCKPRDYRSRICLFSRTGSRLCRAAAGGINARNAAAYAAAGADILVTSAPYSAPPLDVAVQIEPAG